MNSAPERRPIHLSGVGLSPGVGAGTVVRVESRRFPSYRIRISSGEVASELERLEEALEESRRQLRRVKERLEAEAGPEHAYIIDAHLLILEDPQLLERIHFEIRENLLGAEHAFREAAERWLGVYQGLDDPYFQERGSDLAEVMERVLSNLFQLQSREPGALPEEIILAAPEISLFMLAEYPLKRLRGVVVSKGGATSHAAIIARSYQIPVVSGIGNLESVIRSGDTLIVDGSRGEVVVRPSSQELRRAGLGRGRVRRARPESDVGPCFTLDGRRIRMYANVEDESEVSQGLELGAEGVGLFRTEYLYMREKERPVGEEEQYQIYRRLAQTTGSRVAIVRLLDIGDESHPYFSTLVGEESVLGLRGIRLSLRYPEISSLQLRAILRAAAYGNLSILLPMVSGLDEVREARAFIRRVAEELQQEGKDVQAGIRLGVMLEVPSAVVMMEAIAAEVDFFAVGTNDLMQYTLAASRNDPHVSYLFNPLHPAVLRTLDLIRRVSTRAGRITYVCGEMASHPVYARVLVGIGFQHLSMNALAIPAVKQVLRETSYREAAERVAVLLSCPTLEETQEQLESWTQCSLTESR